MKRMRKSLFAVLIVLLLAAVLLLPALAEQEELAGDLLVVESEETIISDRVNGDLLGFAVGITVNGEVQGSIRAVATTLEMNNVVHRNVTVAGGSIVCGEEFSAYYVAAAAGEVIFRGECDTLSITASRVVIAGTVHGEIQCAADTVIILESASFASAHFVGASEPVVVKSENDSSYQSLGSSSFADVVTFEQTQSEFVRKLIDLPFTLFSGIGLALAVSLVLGRVAERLSLRFRGSPVPFCLKGFGGLVLVLIASIFLLMMVFTTMIGVVMLLAYVLIWLVAKAFTAALLGRLLFTRWNPHLSTCLVAAVIALTSVIPVVSGLVTFFCLLVAFGSAVSLLFTKQEPVQNVPLDMDFRV